MPPAEEAISTMCLQLHINHYQPDFKSRSKRPGKQVIPWKTGSIYIPGIGLSDLYWRVFQDHINV
jgi:hypothetical protein